MIFIPLIVLSIRIFLSEVYIGQPWFNWPGLREKMKFRVGRLLSNIYVIYYFTYGWQEGFLMLVYFTWIECAYYYINDNIPRKYLLAFYIFVFSWTMQFIGHEIEGNKPALFDSLSQAFTAAPLFSIRAFLST
tara:strand:- start:4830 stop:5228 length:399 start_codon:yes stop_codon:yes gene_type:complete